MSNKLRVFESFAGVGSQSMALRNLGIDFEVVGISEVDRYGLLSYSAIHNNLLDTEIEYPSKEEMLKEIESKNIAYNFSTGKSQIPKNIDQLKLLYKAHILSKNHGDIRLINTDNLPDFDFFTYSFPCKNISTAGKQTGFDRDSNTQSSLLWECEKIIRAKMPKFLMLENVKNIVSKKYIGNFEEWIKILDDIGYKSYWRVMNGIDFNVPQKRERVIMISIRNDIDIDFEMPIGKPTTKRFIDMLEDNVDEDFYITNPNYQNYLRQVIEANINDTTRKDCVRRIGGLFDKEGKRRQSGSMWDKYGFAPTIDTMQGGYNKPMIIDKGRMRDITPKEAWRTQGFCDSDFEKVKEVGLSNSRLYERAGRGIVVPMLERIFENMLKNTEYIKNN